MNRPTRSAVIHTPVERLWPLLRSFVILDWNEVVVSCRLADGVAGGVGAVRTLALASGERLREQLISLSDRDRSARWCLLGSTEARETYVVTVRIRPVTDRDASFVAWHVETGRSAGQRGDAQPSLALQLVEADIAGLRRRFAQQPLATGDGDALARFRALDINPSAQSDGVVEAVRRSGAAAFPQSDAGSLQTDAIVVERHGGPEVLVRHSVTVPAPGPGEIRVRHEAIGVNMIDVHGRDGLFGLGPLPAVPGMEGAGVVLDVGSGVEGVRPGDRIGYAGWPPGAYTGIRVVPADIVVPLPSFLDGKAAAAVLLKGITADLLIHDVHPLQRGEIVLLHAAAGGLGLLLAGWARALGATVIGVVSTDKKVDAAAQAGCEAVIVSSREDVAETARRMTGGRGVDVVFDAIGRDTFDASLAALAPRGHLVSFGQVSGPVGVRDVDAFAARSIRLSRPNFASYTNGPAILRARAERLFAAVEAGQVRPVVDSLWRLAEAADAHRRLVSRGSIGSVLLIPPSG